ncbi:MAG: glycosyltransferase [Caldilineaceae bacterium]
MHIGVLTHNYPRFPGDFSGIFIQSLCAELAAQQQRITVWAPYDPAYEKGGGEHHPFTPSPPHPLTPSLHLYRYIWPPRLHRLGYMRTMQADLAMRLEAYLLSPAMFAAGIAKVTRDARRLRPDVLHAHWLLPNGFIAAVAARRLGIPLVISVPGSDAQVARANPLFRTMARFAMRQANLLTANSTDLRDAVLEIEPAAVSRFDLIIYGTDPQKFVPDATGVGELKQQWRSRGVVEWREGAHASSSTPPLLHSSTPFFLLCVGRMTPKKGFDVLIRALAQPELAARDVLAVMVGEGDQKAALQTLAHELGVAERLRWVGNVPNDQISRYYNACDVLINPSVRNPVDGLNVCVLDAMSCAKPVVASDVSGSPLAVVDGETGLLVPENDPADLAAALAKLIDDPGLRQRMGQAARQRIEQGLGWPPLARRYITHYARLTP